MTAPTSRRSSSRRSRWRKLALVVGGMTLVVAGMTLGALPVVPGTPMVLGGLALVSTHSPRGRLLRSRGIRWLRQRGLLERLGFLTRRFPSLATALRLSVPPRSSTVKPVRLDQPALVPVGVSPRDRSASTTFNA